MEFQLPTLPVIVLCVAKGKTCKGGRQVITREELLAALLNCLAELRRQLQVVTSKRESAALELLELAIRALEK